MYRVFNIKAMDGFTLVEKKKGKKRADHPVSPQVSERRYGGQRDEPRENGRRQNNGPRRQHDGPRRQHDGPPRRQYDAPRRQYDVSSNNAPREMPAGFSGKRRNALVPETREEIKSEIITTLFRRAERPTPSEEPRTKPTISSIESFPVLSSRASDSGFFDAFSTTLSLPSRGDPEKRMRVPEKPTVVSESSDDDDEPQRALRPRRKPVALRPDFFAPPTFGDEFDNVPAPPPIATSDRPSGAHVLLGLQRSHRSFREVEEGVFEGSVSRSKTGALVIPDDLYDIEEFTTLTLKIN